MAETHVVPTEDLIEHETSPGCVCVPTADPELPMYTHHSLDGRESEESP